MITLPRNARESVVVRLRGFRGRRFVDVRCFFTDANGQSCPSAKGTSIPVEHAEALADAIRAVAVQEAADGD